MDLFCKKTYIILVCIAISALVQIHAKSVGESVFPADGIAADNNAVGLDSVATVSSDTVRVADDIMLSDSKYKHELAPGPFTLTFGKQTKFLSYLDRLVTGNVDRTFEKKIDVNYIVMPSYTREGSFGIGGGATGLYRLDKTDSIMSPSDVTLIGNVTLNGLFSLTAYGNNLFPGRKLRLSYKLEFTYSPLDFWGTTAEACRNNPKISYTRQQLKWNSDLMYRLGGPFYMGTSLDLIYSKVLQMDNWDYLGGENRHYFFTGIGVTFQYDTRDFIPNPKRGMNFVIGGGVKPQFLGSFSRTLFNAKMTYNAYLPAWKGALLAFDAYASYNCMESPWPLRESLGSGGIRMRGYYGGRYIDNNLISVQAELRQHIFDRIGCAAWVGAGGVFHTYDSIRMRNILPNYGIGLRIELKHNVNGRIDYGFGKGTGGFVFSIGEAF